MKDEQYKGVEWLWGEVLLLGIVKRVYSVCRLVIQLPSSKWRPYIFKINTE